ncbi:MAG: B12-binding domain-containing radical SAM protein [Clostridia bacterium]
MNQKVAIVNSAFALDASPSGIPIKLANIKGLFNKVQNSSYDLDIDLFEYLCRDKSQYDIIQYMLGGFTFSYPTSANIPSNYFPFETMPMAELLMSMMYRKDNAAAISDTCRELGIQFDDACKPMKAFMEFLKDCTRRLSAYDEVVISCNSISSVYFAILLSRKIKETNNSAKIYSIGKNVLIPEIKEFIDSLEIIDDMLEDIFELGRLYDIDDDAFDKLDFDAVDISKYDTKLGFHNVNISCSEGCPGRCDFCSIRLSWNNNHIKDRMKYYSLQRTLKHLKQIEGKLGKCFVHIDDCTFNSGSPHAYKLLEGLKECNMLFSCNLRADHIDDNYINRLKEANFYKAIVGLETVSEKTAKLLNKGGDNYVDEAKKAIIKLIESGIIIQMNILLYHPLETAEDIKHSVSQWKAFFEQLENAHLYNYEAPIGTLCLNYPSKMYFNVMNDNNFKVYYHILPKPFESKITERVKRAFESIPHYAIRLTDREAALHNKMNTVHEIYEYSKREEISVSHYISTILSIADAIRSLWFYNNTAVFKNHKYDLLKSENKLIERIKEQVKNRPITVKKLSESVEADHRTFVASLAILEKEGFIKLKTLNGGYEEGK